MHVRKVCVMLDKLHWKSNHTFWMVSGQNLVGHVLIHSVGAEICQGMCFFMPFLRWNFWYNISCSFFSMVVVLKLELKKILMLKIGHFQFTPMGSNSSIFKIRILSELSIKHWCAQFLEENPCFFFLFLKVGPTLYYLKVEFHIVFLKGSTKHRSFWGSLEL